MQRDLRNIPIPVRFSAAERETLRQAAESEHMFVSSWLRKAAMEVAEKELAATDRDAR